jgi:hypothetical protein
MMALDAFQPVGIGRAFTAGALVRPDPLFKKRAAARAQE